MSKKQPLHSGAIARNAVQHLRKKTKKDCWLWGFLLVGGDVFYLYCRASHFVIVPQYRDQRDLDAARGWKNKTIVVDVSNQELIPDHSHWKDQLCLHKEPLCRMC